MTIRHRLSLALAVMLALTSAPGGTAAAPPLRVCSDPNNLPFSNRREEGFENALASRLAQTLGTTVEYTWWPQRRGFLARTLDASRCDVVMGYPADAHGVLTTAPYYRSTYVFLTRRSSHLSIRSFDDPRLRTLRIGVQVIGDDGMNSPPAHALSRRGIVQNLIGFSVYGDYSTESPASVIVQAVTAGHVDIAAAWGPLAGYFAARSPVPLDVIPVSAPGQGDLPQSFAIAMAVRAGDTSRLDRLNRFIRDQRADIDAILRRYHIPLVP